MALKNAYLQVAMGEKRTAVSVASEFASRFFKNSRYEEMGVVAEEEPSHWRPHSCATCSRMGPAQW